MRVGRTIKGKISLRIVRSIIARNQRALVYQGFNLLKNSHPESQTERHILKPRPAIYTWQWTLWAYSAYGTESLASAFRYPLIVGDKRSTSTECRSRSPRKVTTINTARMAEQADYQPRCRTRVSINRANLSFIPSSGRAIFTIFDFFLFTSFLSFSFFLLSSPFFCFLDAPFSLSFKLADWIRRGAGDAGCYTKHRKHFSCCFRPGWMVNGRRGLHNWSVTPLCAE